MIEYYRQLIEALRRAPRNASALGDWAQLLPQQVSSGLSERRYGDLPAWREVLAQLPAVTASAVVLGDTVTVDGDCGGADARAIAQQLKKLIPWRKGPYRIHGTHIDTEWRSDWKWRRLLPHITPLHQRLVLDVGCGNGYHCWRMLEAGAQRVIGIDPSPRFVLQFHAIKHFVGPYPVDVVPIGIESLPAAMRAFDTAFSMGVLYHRRSPMDHLRELRDSLRAGGELVLETLVIEGKPGEVLVPEGRYAMMNNVWFLPSCDTLLSWLRKCGFANPRLVDINTTSVEEQRTTEWMRFHSLRDFLDPDEGSLTVEGHPAPKRAIFIARAM